jgi:hypothetical protein
MTSAYARLAKTEAWPIPPDSVRHQAALQGKLPHRNPAMTGARVDLWYLQALVAVM